MDPHYEQWLHLFLRWTHMITGIAWIGASFYFNWLEGHLNRQNQKKGIAGDLWAIHGGGVYYLIKYELSPDELPENLHWFKWEAYLTWITGISLLSLLYYFHAQVFLLDPQIAQMNSSSAVGLGVASLTVSWFFYHSLCKTALIYKPKILSSILFAYFVGLAYTLTHIFSTRAAYVHFGAAIGTIMVLNVFFVIIPSQSQLVASMKAKSVFNPDITKRASLRSLHNNYFTLPVLFVMISNHFPITFAHSYHWQILVALSLVGLLTRHFFNLRNKGQIRPWLLVAALGLLLALAVLTKPEAPTVQTETSPVDFQKVASIITQRCVSCHSSHPNDKDFTIAPNGVMFDTAEQIRSKAAMIKMRVVDVRNMPFINRTQMTEAERQVIAQWFQNL